MTAKMLKNIQKNEQGRSMVEMLGVLAVIGVLSIAGIAGYTTAMKRHRANELLNEASKRAVVLAMKIAAGQTLPSTASPDMISEFTDPSDYTFKVLANSDTNKFDMQITGVSEEVCEQMKVMIGNDGMMTISDCATSPLTLTFNKDLSKGSSTPSGPTVEEDEVDLASCTADHSGFDNEQQYTGDYTNQVLSNGDRCMCDSSFPIWNGNECSKSSNKSCNSSTPCSSGEYCRYQASGLSRYFNTNDDPLTAKNGSVINGTCEKVSGVKQTTDGKFYYSKSYMDWFSAKNWCEALPGNHKLIKEETLTSAPFNCDFASVTCKKCDLEQNTCVMYDMTTFTSIGLTGSAYWGDRLNEAFYNCEYYGDEDFDACENFNFYAPSIEPNMSIFQPAPFYSSLLPLCE